MILYMPGLALPKAVIIPLKGVLIIYKNLQVKYRGTSTGYASKQLGVRRTQFSTILGYCLGVGDNGCHKYSEYQDIADGEVG